MKNQTSKRAIPGWMPLALLLAAGTAAPGADIFTFAGVTWNQTNTPNRARLLGNNEVLGGAAFSAGVPTSATANSTTFPSAAGFDASLTLAALTGLGSGARSVNLPNGNNGTSTRHGIEVSWTVPRGAPNLTGPDFVVFETGSSQTGVEGVMARVHLDPQDTWTAWHYFPPANFQNADGSTWVFAYTFDLSDMGVPPGAVFDKIQIANLTYSDCMFGPGTAVGNYLVGEGRVVFELSNNVLPDAGTFATSRVFDQNSLDPDPLYVAVLQNTVPLAPRLRHISRSSGQIDLLVYTAPGTFTLESNENLSQSNGWQLVTTFTNLPGGAMTVSDTGQNGRPLPQTVPQRFYRLRTP